MKKLLFVLTAFVALTSIVCGMLLVRDASGASLRLPLIVLNHTPFNDFTIPGYLLLVLVGGSNFCASLALYLDGPKAWSWAAVSGLIICGWIFMEVVLTRVLFWLQFIYLGLGICILLIAFQGGQNRFHKTA